MGARISDPLLSVGSLPFATAEAALRGCGSTIGRLVPGLSDGEVGERWDWIGFLERQVFAGHPDLDEDTVSNPQNSAETAERLAAGDRAAQYEIEGTTRGFRIKPGVENLRFDDLYAGRVALESYAGFRRLRDEGVIPEGLRFQVCLPGATSAIEPYFTDPADWPQAKRAYLEGVAHELRRLLEVIPAEDLVVQFDLCFEIMDLTLGADESLLHWAPSATPDEKWDRHTEQLSALGAAVPEDVLFGYHLCYGTWGGWPMVDLRDLSLCVRLANAVVERSGRTVDYVHMPVSQQPDAAFFAPLDDLSVPDTRVYLGLIHLTDGLSGFRERVRLAKERLPDFGVATVCGFGRNSPDEAPMILRILRECAGTLRRELAA